MALSRYHDHWLFVWIPLFGAFIWFGTLLALLITWLASGRPQYVTQQGTIAYISDVAASFLKPLFIVGCSITAVCFFLSLVAERTLRHTGRLLPNLRRREKFFSILAIISSFIGGVGLILLSIFDTKNHPSLHRLFLLIFMLGVAFSAIFTIIEFRWIQKDYRNARVLRVSYIAKGIIASILIILAIAFGVTLYENRSKTQNAAAVLEWAVSFGFTLYLLTFYYDLRFAKGHAPGDMYPRSSGERLVPRAGYGNNGYQNGGGMRQV